MMVDCRWFLLFVGLLISFVVSSYIYTKDLRTYWLNASDIFSQNSTDFFSSGNSRTNFDVFFVGPPMNRIFLFPSGVELCVNLTFISLNSELLNTFCLCMYNYSNLPGRLNKLTRAYGSANHLCHSRFVFHLNYCSFG